MVWNYHDDDVPAPAAAVDLSIRGIPAAAHRVLLVQYRIDQTHSNAYAVWKQMGSPQQPTADQYAKLKEAGQLEMLGSPRWAAVQDGRLTMHMELPRQGISLVRVTW
jgi:xylan 1,4-beta-xylosidase